MDILWRIYPASSPPAKLRVVEVRSLTDRAVRFKAIDEIHAYYRAATSDLDVAIPRCRPPESRVIAATFAEVPVRIGTAWAVELTISLATAGDWRGGEVYADDGGQTRCVATLAAGATEAAWLVRRPGEIAVTAVPGAASAPAGPSFTTTHAVAGGGRDAGAFHAPVAEAIWDDAAARQAVVDRPRSDDTVTLYRDDSTWAETRVWDDTAWRPAPRRHDGAVLADWTVHADTIAPRSVTVDKLSVHDLSAIAAELGSITVDRAHIADGAITSAKFADTIQSDPFEPGRHGWWIQRDGRAEFNDIVLSRQLQADSGSLDLRAIQVRRTTQPAIAASWIVETSVTISAWDGTNNTYLATAGLANIAVTAKPGDPPDVLFGVQATVLPLTIWSGLQVLRLKLRVDDDFDGSGLACFSFDEALLFEFEDHLVDGEWCDVEVVLHVGLSGRPLIDDGIGVNEGKVLALLFSEARGRLRVTRRLPLIHHSVLGGGHRDEHTLACRVEAGRAEGAAERRQARGAQDQTRPDPVGGGRGSGRAGSNGRPAGSLPSTCPRR